MNRRTALATTAMAFLSLAGPMLAGGGAAFAQGRSDTDRVKSRVNDYIDAMSARDIGKMERIWLHDSYAMVVTTRSNSADIGWDAIKKHWADGVFTYWSDLKVTLKGEPQIRVARRAGRAWATYVVRDEGKNKNGQALAYDVLVTQGFEKRGNRWLLATHHASRAPE
jgi:ketosteroid isomerase-like protein